MISRTVLLFLSVLHFILCLKSFALSATYNLIYLSQGYFNLSNCSRSMFINLNRRFSVALTQPAANWLPQILMLGWLPMSGAENACCNLPSTSAWVHTVLRTLWCWSVCCRVWLEQEWLPSCMWRKKRLPHWTEDIDIMFPLYHNSNHAAWQ